MTRSESGMIPRENMCPQTVAVTTQKLIVDEDVRLLGIWNFMQSIMASIRRILFSKSKQAYLLTTK
jgi:hypothetical protein